jgi:P-type Cu+ transporter
MSEGRATKTSLAVSGMTWPACARRVEKAISRVPGVVGANVNLAAKRAAVEYLPGVAGVRDLERVVEGAGYGVPREEEHAEDARVREYGRLRNRFVVAAVLTGFILVSSLPHMFGFEAPVSTGWLDFGLFLLATPVQFWAGWRFYRGACGSLRYTSADIHEHVGCGRDERRLPI